MRLCMESNRFEMQAGQTLELRNGKGTQLEVLSGELWITQEGDRRDPVVKTGGEFAIERNGLTLLHAFQTTLVYVQDRARAPAQAGKSWKKAAADLLSYFGELGMKRNAWRCAYRI